ncbi:MAG TPA: hypothetical protein VEG32_00955 [Clostridia bacterium]|nr:hypothetical protein [Clostridia bacterium]
MYELIQRARDVRRHSGTEAPDLDVAEIAACLALRSSDPVVAAPWSIGSRLARNADTLLAPEAAPTLDSNWAVLTAQPTPGPLQNLTAFAVAHLSGMHNPCALVSFGDLHSDPQWRNAIRVAARQRLPILYIVHNDSTTRGKADLRTIQAEYGVPVILVDHSDAIAIYRVTTEAAHNARVGRGATVIAATRVSSPTDPLEALKAYMERHGAWANDM